MKARALKELLQRKFVWAKSESLYFIFIFAENKSFTSTIQRIHTRFHGRPPA